MKLLKKFKTLDIIFDHSGRFKPDRVYNYIAKAQDLGLIKKVADTTNGEVYEWSEAEAEAEVV